MSQGYIHCLLHFIHLVCFIGCGLSACEIVFNYSCHTFLVASSSAYLTYIGYNPWRLIKISFVPAQCSDSCLTVGEIIIWYHLIYVPVELHVISQTRHRKVLLLHI